MFYNTSAFNQPLNNWNVSNVEYMNSMFTFANSFNQPLNNWNVSKVKNMKHMFCKASSFNQPLNKWNVSNVEDMLTVVAPRPAQGPSQLHDTAFRMQIDRRSRLALLSPR
jgi:surface protein